MKITDISLKWLKERGPLIITAILLALFGTFLWYVASGFSDNSTNVTVAIAAITAFLAAFSSIASWQYVIEIRQQRKNQERPYIYADIKPVGKGYFHLRLENFGNSPALNVIVNVKSESAEIKGPPSQTSFFKSPISFFPPGKVIHQVGQLGEGKPAILSLLVTYHSIYGEHYSDAILLDLEYLRETVLPPKTSEELLVSLCKSIDKLTKIFDDATGLSIGGERTPILTESYDQNLARFRHEIERRKKGKQSNRVSAFRTYILSKWDGLRS